MLRNDHRESVLREIPEGKRTAKRARTVQGIATALFGAALAFGAMALAIITALNGGTFDKWLAGLVALLFTWGMVMVSQGAHNVSGELTSAAWKDIALTVNSVWKRRGGDE